MNIADEILEERGRFFGLYGHHPDYVYLGHKQAAEIDAMIEQCRRFGLIAQGTPLPRAKFHGMQIFRVDADSHLSFGVAQPSPCG